MATKKKGRETLEPPDRKTLEQLMFGTGRVRRFTQDSPVLPDVWLEYAKGQKERATRLTTLTDPKDPFPPIKLLLTPCREHSAGVVRRELRWRLAQEREKSEWRAFGHPVQPMPRVAYNQTTVAATLGFEDLIRVVLPMTEWWARLDRLWKIEEIQLPEMQKELAKAVEDPEHPPSIATGRGIALRLPPDLLWAIRVVGALALYHQRKPLPAGFLGEDGVAGATYADWEMLTVAFSELIRGLTPISSKPHIELVSLNRVAFPTIFNSTRAIKSDAAHRVFNISCGDLAWAIIDGGVDATHPAFRRRLGDWGPPFPSPFQDQSRPGNFTRVVETYDFSQIDLLLDPDTEHQPGVLKENLHEGSESMREYRAALDDLNAHLASGRILDWSLIAPLLLVPHENGRYQPPSIDHGTHVAGIIASNWRTGEEGLSGENLIGICPDIRIYDLRVLDERGRGDEFTVMAALQFVRYLNSAADFMPIHGVNLSLSIPHDVSNYACGRTPVCEECNRVVSSGVVVVAAAGNQGYRSYMTAEGGAAEAYNGTSISDPGNADLVITVGATHSSRPHAYGVSYFSSRGPTGDGRSKPDIVAPGEHITAPLPEGLYGRKDGTSMAAAHVSGAAALLMSRNSDLVGSPLRIKQILCDTATDLGREKYFQGAGIVDILRALQSI